jgi:hypothetical protein
MDRLPAKLPIARLRTISIPISLLFKIVTIIALTRVRFLTT